MRGVRALIAVAVGVMLFGPGTQAAAETSAPGAVVRDVELTEAARLTGAEAQRQLTYWTEGPTGAPALSTGAVYLPAGPPPDGGWPVVSWAHGTTGVGDACAPSHGYDVTILTREYLKAWLAAGFAVVATTTSAWAPRACTPTSTVAARGGR